jgi:hypothetical protein
MGYIGTPIDTRNQFQSLQGKRFNGDGSTTDFTLDVAPSSTLDIEVFVGNVRQDPNSAYTLSGTTLSFTGAPPSGTNNIYVVHQAKSVGTINPGANSVGVTELNLSDGSNGQVLQTNGSGTLSFATVDTSSATDSFTISGSTPTLTIGDAGAEDTKIVFDGNAQDFHIGLDDSADSLTIGLGSTLGTTSHMVIDATGAVTKPLQPAFFVKSAAMNNLATATNHDVQFSTEVFDNNADFNTSTYTFTAPVTGRYCINVQLKINNIDTAGDYYNANVDASNNGFLIFYYKPSQLFSEDANAFSMSSTMLIDMDANDTAKVIFRPQAGSAQADINANESLFSGFLVC